MHPYTQSGQRQDVLHITQARLAIDQTAYMCLILLKCILSLTRLFIWMHERNTTKNACTSFPEDEHLDVRNMSQTLLLN